MALRHICFAVGLGATQQRSEEGRGFDSLFSGLLPNEVRGLPLPPSLWWEEAHPLLCVGR